MFGLNQFLGRKLGEKNYRRKHLWVFRGNFSSGVGLQEQGWEMLRL